MSIQASENHYCTPRKTIDLKGYTEMEIAIFDNNDWANPHEDDRFKDFSRLDELLERFQEGEIAVGAYLAVDLIQDLYEYLIEQ